MNYYVYIYLREDGSPYNVGKGKGNRWKEKHRVEVPPAARVIFPITQTTEEWAHFMEMEFIDFYGRLNDGTGILENWTDGGEGSSGRIFKHSEETKRKMSESRKGIMKGPMSEEQKRRISQTKKGQLHTEETKKKMSESQRRMSDETKQKISEANKGTKKPPRTEEHRKKISDARKGKILSAEHKQKISDSLKNRQTK